MPHLRTEKGIIAPLNPADVQIAPTEDGRIALVILNDGVRHIVTMTPGECQGYGSSMIGMAAIVDLQNQQRAAAKRPAILVPNGRH